MFGNLIVLVVDILWVPLKMFNLINLPYIIEDRVGQVILIGWYCAEFSHLLLSLNRFFAITAPLAYQKIFSTKNTVYLTYLNVILSCCMIIPYSFHNICTFYFDKYFWVYLETTLCNIFSKIQDFGLGIIMGLLVLSIDVITFTIYLCKKERKKSGITKNNIDIRQIRIFFQTVLANISLIACCTQFHIIAPYYVGTGSMEFVLTTFQWMEYHSLSGFILGICYRDLYLHLKKIFLRPKIVPTKVKIFVNAVTVATDSNEKK
ncbi:7TM GPCR, serpentine receptor class x (Srx) family-containing protein [Strongyloides ratti]|uniref:7TM GPCR, serpentine receptor class x (Srx) family-containing protein n=1 Tax=Strongyloides ratti TaxID=34506 RepID=A0A090KZC3_STRRB|nr:7TM GPCR, serpentine receptor class x (Srx) family-containing protein [Strongyloides ratti]CEF62766.1 7TM GPCR, serpentine receptor class x (Srx) family-containing protein [Strongyloides ratti]